MQHSTASLRPGPFRRQQSLHQPETQTPDSRQFLKVNSNSTQHCANSCLSTLPDIHASPLSGPPCQPPPELYSNRVCAMQENRAHVTRHALLRRQQQQLLGLHPHPIAPCAASSTDCECGYIRGPADKRRKPDTHQPVMLGVHTKGSSAVQAAANPCTCTCNAQGLLRLGQGACMAWHAPGRNIGPPASPLSLFV